jgi:hypothetical protein
VTPLLVYTSTPAGQGRDINLDFQILAFSATSIYVWNEHPSTQVDYIAAYMEIFSVF